MIFGCVTAMQTSQNQFTPVPEQIVAAQLRRDQNISVHFGIFNPDDDPTLIINANGDQVHILAGSFLCETRAEFVQRFGSCYGRGNRSLVVSDLLVTRVDTDNGPDVVYAIEDAGMLGVLFNDGIFAGTFEEKRCIPDRTPGFGLPVHHPIGG